jgi:hypothetical protein
MQICPLKLLVIQGVLQGVIQGALSGVVGFGPVARGWAQCSTQTVDCLQVWLPPGILPPPDQGYACVLPPLDQGYACVCPASGNQPACASALRTNLFACQIRTNLQMHWVCEVHSGACAPFDVLQALLDAVL